MVQKRYWKLTFLLLAVAAFSLMIRIGIWHDANSCMGVKMLSETEYARLSDYQYADFSQQLFQNGEPAAIDYETSTIYVSQAITSSTLFADLSGTLELRVPGYELCFAPDTAFDNLSDAVAEGHRFSLLAIAENNTYMKYHIVFTTLPVMKMEGAISGVNDDGRDVYSGSLCLWTPNDPDTEHYTVKPSDAQWHVRGQATASLPKKSWKISLKTKSGDNRNLAMLGLGEDDDWILFSMFNDDTKIREKLIMDTWNEMQESTDYQLRMSSGEYVEVVANGHYQGLYLLQRRVDLKYLNLDKTTTSLFKGKGVFSAQVPQDVYDLVSSPWSSDDAYKKIQPYFDFIQGTNSVGGALIHLNNWLDVSLFVQYGLLIDNYLFNNVYYILCEDDSGCHLYFILWDMDMSLGLYFRNGIGITYEPDTANRGTNYERIEKDYLVSLYPELQSLLKTRWNELRNSVFEETAICSRAVNLNAQIEQSGALLRDQTLWGARYNGADTIDGLLTYLQNRAQWLDEYYSK